MSYRRLLPALGLVLLPALARPAAAAHPHYEHLLREGTFSLERGDAVAAVEDLRLACFGYLEEPGNLADCLARLALAQAAAGDEEGFRDTFRRVAELEDRFEAYSGAEIPGARRQAFEAEVAGRIPPTILAETPAFGHLVPPVEPGPQAELDRGAAPAPATPVLPEEPAAAPLAAAQEAQLDRARELLGLARERGDLDEPWRLARQVADDNPDSRPAQHLTAVIAYRAARWDDAVTYFRRGGEPDEGTPEVLFYYAVSLYEVGEREEAATVLRRILPRIEHTPFVMSYREKILGPLERPPENG